MPYANYSPQEVESRGEAIYQQELRERVEAQHRGKFLVVDIETGQYEIDGRPSGNPACSSQAAGRRPVWVANRVSSGVSTGRTRCRGRKMIAGRVTSNREAVIELQLAGSARQVPQIQAIIDTGYNGYLTLPGHLITAYELPFAGHRRAALTHGSHVILEVYLTAVAWHGRQ